MRHPLGVAAVLLLAAPLLAACEEAPVLGILEREQGEQDMVTIQRDLEGVDLSSTRFLAEAGPIEYFVATPADSDGRTACLLIEEGIGVALECGPLTAGQAGVLIRDSRMAAVLLPDDYDRDSLDAQGYRLLHPNLAVRESPEV
ncbi:hypothetical protein [Arthrobacter sp. Br18]|uniref:hypothetical protein n=1 Tax=Arthrobacter sp. Br18 TaxID=1312954 RepID=UPI00047956DF|nr:hypothetical protein [Arthrobacter sp. Br18]